jgi:stalled ribosome rescue protein Dom34
MTKTTSHQHSLRQVAVWVDHREAIVTIFKDAHLLHEEEIFSEANPQTHGDHLSKKHIQAHQHAILEHFYKEIIQDLKSADQVIIYGPGQAKHELAKHIQADKSLQGHILDVIATEKMTETELNNRALADFKAAHRAKKN